MGYFVKRVYDKNTGKEVKFQDKVKNEYGSEFHFMWVTEDEVCVSGDSDDFYQGKPDEFGLVVKEVEMPFTYYFAIYTYTKLFEGKSIKPINFSEVKFHGFVGILTKKKITGHAARELEKTALNFAYLKAKCQMDEMFGEVIAAGKGKAVSAEFDNRYCALKVISMPHLNYDFCPANGDKSLIECIKDNYNFFREQVSRENYRTAYEIDLDKEGGVV